MDGYGYLTEEELTYYIRNNEEYYKKHYPNVKHDFHVGEVVKISDDTYNKGYAGMLGIVISWTGVGNYVYVAARDCNAKRYWVCGFPEYDLERRDCTINDVSEGLRSAYFYWIKSNWSHFLPENNNNNKLEKLNLSLTKDEYDVIPIIISMTRIYLQELFDKTIEDKFWEQHKENIYLIYKYYQEHSSGIMANANKILEKINNSNNNLL